MNEKLASYWDEKRLLINGAIEDYFLSWEGHASRLGEAMRYSLTAGGKRLRPVLAIMGYELAGGGDPGDIMPLCLALEFIHTFSLIHDDLPAIDNDDLRRGKPTSHKVFGEAVAILAGDALLAEAVRLMAEADWPPGIKAGIITEVARAMGKDGVIAGEIADVLAEKEAWEPTPELVRYIHSRKTASLISASLCAGAMAGGVDPGELDFLRKQGAALGLLFQITDDILDVVGEEEKVGKGLRKDEDKITWVKVFGLRKAQEDADRLASEISRALQHRFREKAWALCELVSFIARRDY